MTCKDCYHHDACEDMADHPDWEYLCRCFKHKSAVIELPLPATEELKEELTKHCFDRCVEEL